MRFDPKGARLFFGDKEIAELSDVEYSVDVQSEEPPLSLGPTDQITTSFTTDLGPLTNEQCEALRWLCFRMLGSLLPAEFARDKLAASRHPNAVPLEQAGTAARGRAVLGVTTWRMLGELQAPLHRRTSMSIWWARALKSCPAEATAAFAEVRRAAGEFDSEALTTN